MSRGATLLSGLFAAFVLFFATSEAHAVCCGTTCCSIGGVCRRTGDTNPANSCEECRPSGSGGQFGWTPISGCTATPDAGSTTMTDAGSTTTPPPRSGSCNATTGSGSAPLALAALALGLAIARRR